MSNARLDRYLHTPATWHPTSDPLVRWSATIDDLDARLRINDFPAEHLYTLLVNGAVVGDFDTWPAAWTRVS